MKEAVIRMVRLARWKIYAVCAALALAIVANIAQVLLASQTRSRLDAEIDARLSVAYAAALNDALQAKAQPTLAEAAVRITVLRARLDGAKTALSQMGNATGEDFDAFDPSLTAAISAAQNDDAQGMEAALRTFADDMLGRIDALSIPDKQKTALRDAYR